METKNLKKVLTESQKFIERLEKKALTEQQNRIKPGECLKYIKTTIDPSILNCYFGTQILSTLDGLKIPVEIAQQAIPEVISWTRSVQQLIRGHNDMVQLTDKTEDIPHILYVMQAIDVCENIHNVQLNEVFRNVGIIWPNCRATLLICGLKEYCRKHPKTIRRLAVETCLAELQITLNVSHRLLDTAADLANTVMQFSKSVAEIPYKKQEAEKQANQNFYVSNDNKDCVAVKGTIGLSNLWQHHLIRLPLVALETAEAIIGKYPMPRNLLDDYETLDDCPNLLTNIPVRRAGGPLTSVRKIGPELSKKVHLLYTNTNPNLTL